MLTSRDFIAGFRKLDLDPACPVIVHAALSAFGEIQGGADTVLNALLACFETIITPTFTYKTMIVPEVGPVDNGIVYGSGKEANRLAEAFHPQMPSDRTMGALAEAVRTHPRAQRSSHPVLSFAGIKARAILEIQELHEPLLPIGKLVEEEGWVLLVGTRQTANASIHYGEQLAGRKQFMRWALTEGGILSCRGFPGCPQGFDAISPRLSGVRSTARVGGAEIEAVPLLGLMEAVCGLLKQDPLALLCAQADCPRCNAVRAAVAHPQVDQVS